MEAGGRPRWVRSVEERPSRTGDLYDYDVFDLRDPGDDLRIHAEQHSFLGFTWWVARAEGWGGIDLIGARRFRSRHPEKAEDRAIAWVRGYRARQAQVRTRSFPA